MDAIQEALRELFAEGATKKRRKVRAFTDLWDQVYCSLTDGGADSAYLALGELNGKGLYDVYDITGSDVRPGFDTIIVNSTNTEPALKVAEIYGLETKVIPGKSVYIYVPEGAEVRADLLHNTKNVEDVEESVEDDILDEDFDPDLPVQPLPHDVVYDFIQNIPTPTRTIPPRPFSLGYMKELNSEIASKFRGGKRSADGDPVVKIFKCSEMVVTTGYSYEASKEVKNHRKATGKERTGDVTGFNYDSELTIEDKIGATARGSLQLQCFVRDKSVIRVKYFIRLNDEDLQEASRQEVAQYLTPAKANAILGNAEPAVDPTKPKNYRRIPLSGIYRIGNLGHSVM